METSIVIRVKNEKEHLEKLFELFRNQTYQNFEWIIVDNDSSDGSGKVAFDYFPKNRIKIVELKNFSYPLACNLGAEKANGKYLVYLSAHSYPISKTWIADGLSNFTDEKVAGVFAFPIASNEGSLAEHVTTFPNRFKKGGELGNTNSIIRKDLWKKHRFDEGLIESEDYEWSIYWKSQGYKIINDPKLRVYHSHGESFGELMKKHKRWAKQREEINKKFKN